MGAPGPRWFFVEPWGAVIVRIRVLRSAVRDVVLASAVKSFITDVSNGAGAAVEGGAVRSRSDGADRRRERARVERGPRRAGGGMRYDFLHLAAGFSQSSSRFPAWYQYGVSTCTCERP